MAGLRIDEVAIERTATRRAAPLTAAIADAVAAAERGDAVVLVEGSSDQVAVETLARRTGRDLATEGISVVAIGGATTIRYFLDLLGPHGHDVVLAGLCDVAEERDFRRGAERAGLGSDLTRADMATRGFHVCIDDLEDELIGALGARRVEGVLRAEGELGSFRTFQKQPGWRDRPVDDQLHRFMGTRAHRKIRYARLLVQALDLDRVPAPLAHVLASVS